MFDKRVFVSLRKEFEGFESSRDVLVKLSRDVLRSSKNAIHAAQRGDIEGSAKLLRSAASVVKRIQKVAKDPHLATVGAVGEAFEEYVEACCFLAFCRGRKLPSPGSLGVGMHAYLPGICDLVGELFRKAMNDAIKGKYDSVFVIKDFVSDLYAELMLFDWRSAPRRKFDSIKYHLEKLEDLAVQLKLKR